MNKSNNLMSIDRIFENSKIVGVAGNHYLKLKLNNNDIIIAQLGSLICMNSGVMKADIKFDGFLRGFSKILAGEPLFYQIYKGINKGGFIYLGSNFLNSIIAIKIKKGETYRLSRNCFLASTGNIKISFTVQAKGIFEIGQEEGFFLPIASCESEDYGFIWINAFGNLEKIVIPNNDYLIIDNGMFLACNNNHQYQISKLGKSLFSSFFGGEGFGMKFNGYAEIYIQTKNINNFLTQEQSKENGVDNGEIVGDVLDFF